MTKMATLKKSKARVVMCLDNKGYSASLERRKLYQVLPDAEAKTHGQVRVVDESGEDYLYPASLFLAGVRFSSKQVREKPVGLFAKDAVLRSIRKAAGGGGRVRSKN